MRKYYFITGTDTNIGKTYITQGLLEAFKKRGYSTLGIKPIASGCIETPDGLRNADALLLQQAATVKLPYKMINPIALKMPIAPHIAAAQANLALNTQLIIDKCQPALVQRADIILMEGAGGWHVPINATQTIAHLAKQLALDVILVVGIRLGCLNHAFLTYQAMMNDHVKLKGWVANCINPQMPFINENIEMLSHKIAAPLLGSVPFGGTVEDYIDSSLLI